MSPLIYTNVRIHQLSFLPQSLRAVIEWVLWEKNLRTFFKKPFRKSLCSLFFIVGLFFFFKTIVLNAIFCFLFCNLSLGFAEAFIVKLKSLDLRKWVPIVSNSLWWDVTNRHIIWRTIHFFIFRNLCMIFSSCYNSSLGGCKWLTRRFKDMSESNFLSQSCYVSTSRVNSCQSATLTTFF